MPGTDLRLTISLVLRRSTAIALRIQRITTRRGLHHRSQLSHIQIIKVHRLTVSTVHRVRIRETHHLQINLVPRCSSHKVHRIKINTIQINTARRHSSHHILHTMPTLLSLQMALPPLPEVIMTNLSLNNKVLFQMADRICLITAKVHTLPGRTPTLDLHHLSRITKVAVGITVDNIMDNKLHVIRGRQRQAEVDQVGQNIVAMESNLDIGTSAS